MFSDPGAGRRVCALNVAVNKTRSPQNLRMPELYADLRRSEHHTAIESVNVPPRMNALFEQVSLAIRLNFRNRMAMIYGYLFPTIFLVAFYVLYRADRVPLAGHVGELLTVTILGSASIGFPTALVSERERGVWRRYRLAPLPSFQILLGAIMARIVIAISAGVLQLLLARAVGMPWPLHPFGLLIAFLFVVFAFLGLGLEIAMLADNVPSVQALGQCIFLPMLIIGGVAVRVSSLPVWAQHISVFFPGRYAVDALQTCMTAKGLGGIGFDLLALVLTGLGAGIAGAAMFRWDPGQKLSVRGGRAWAAMGLAAWVVAGALAESRGQVASSTPSTPVSSGAYLKPPPTQPAARTAAAPVPAAQATSAAPKKEEIPPRPAQWQDVTMAHINQTAFDRLPPDSGLASPIARVADAPDASALPELEELRDALPSWVPGQVADPVQRVRNYLYVAAVPDFLEMQDVEGFIPAIVFNRLQEDFSKRDLIRILFWIAINPDDGDDSATQQLAPLGLPNSPSSEEVRNRVQIYSLKLLGRLTGHIAPR